MTAIASSPYVFTHDLSLGADEPEVLLLQKYLNESGFTISTSGIGSPGQETTYFGAKTKEALIRFQQASGIDPTGYFGPATRQYIASTLVVKTVTSKPVVQAVVESRTFQQGVGGYTGGVDNEISEDNATTVYAAGGSNYGNRMGVRNCGTDCNKVLVRFGNLNLNPADTITNVQLQLRVSGTQGGSGSLMASKVARPDWSTSAVSWTNYRSGTAWATAGGDTQGSPVSVAATGADTWVTFNLGTSYTAAELEQNGVIISTNIPGYNYLWFYSNEETNTANRPKLIVTYSTNSPTAPAPTTPAPVVTMSASPASVAYNAAATITWSATDATSCTVTGGRTGTSGSFSTGALTMATSYSATCTGAGGSDTETIMVTVGSQTTPTTDTTAPTAPASLTASAGSMSQINLAWTAATDNVGVTGYRVYRGTTLAATLGSVTSYQDTGRTANTSYSYSIRALDAGGNVSAPSPTASATTLGSATLTPPAGGLEVDLSYVNQSSPEFIRLKSVVDAALAGSPDYGFEPQHAALMYKITGEARYCDYAIQFAESCPNSYENRYGISCGVQGAERSIAAGGQPYVAGDSYLEVGPIIGSLAITYDWCGARMTEAQKTRWKAYADQAIYNVWHPSQATWGGRSYPWTGWSIDNPGNNYYYSFLEASMFWALASHDSTLYTFVRNEKIQPLINYFAQIPGGGSLEGTGYGASHMRLFHLYQVWKDSTGEDIANLSTHMNDSIRFWVHATTPNRAYYAPIGDLARSSFPDLFDYHRRLVLEARNLSTNSTSRDLASWWLNNISVGQMSRRIDSQWDLLPEGTYTAATPNEPLSYRATGIGRIFARTDWGTNALWMSFAAGKYAESHAHQDQGSFTLANNAWLAVTNNIYSNSGIEQTSDYHNVLRFVQNGSIVPQREGNEAVMTVNQLAANGEVDVTGNITPVYGGSSAVQNWTRNVKFAGRKLTVTDNFAVGAGTQAIFQVHTPAQPVVSGNLITAGSLRIRVSTPANPTIQVVSLQGHYRIDISGGTNSYVVELSDQDITGATPTPTPPTTPTSTTPIADLTAPVALMTAPTTGTTVSGSSVVVTASASDNVGVAGVQFRIGGINVGPEDTTAPYSITWNTTSLADGQYSIVAVARDAAGNLGTSAATTVTVRNTVVTADTTAPTVSVSAPTTGLVLSGTAATLAATANDNVGVAGVQFYIDGTAYQAEDTAAPYGLLLNTTGYTNGTHTFTAVARDTAGNRTTSAAVTATINNVVVVADTTVPTAPTGLTASARSSSQVDLAWVHSTDNVAVTGYLVERCQGSGCTTFTPVGTVTANGYTDTAVKSGTAYTYRVQATDARSNRSAYSLTASVTMPRTTSGGGGGGGGGGSSRPKTKDAWLTPQVLSANTTAASVTTSRTTFTESLFIGSKSSQVLALQQFLISKGYLASDSATGLYGPATEAAVKKYQCAKNIVCGGTGASTGYGLVGTATRAALNQDTTSTASAGATTSGLTPEQRQALIQSLLLQVQVLMAKLQAMRGY